jgi:hypothetical protein
LITMGILLAIFLQIVVAESAWTANNMQHEGVTRYYHVYEPSGTKTGLMCFIHGYSTPNNFPTGSAIAPWNVATNADQFGFVGVIPVGTIMASDPGGGSKSGSKRRLQSVVERSDQWSGEWSGTAPRGTSEEWTSRALLSKRRLTSSSVEWNSDGGSGGANDVDFIKSVIEAVTTSSALPADAPRIVFGFSQGSWMTSYLGYCTAAETRLSSGRGPSGADSMADVPDYAHLAVHYNPDAPWPSTCDPLPDGAPCAVWRASGSTDYFIANLQPNPTQGFINQWTANHDSMGCSADPYIQTDYSYANCYEYANCTAVGQLCVFPNVGHVIQPDMTERAWTYLTGPDGSMPCTSAAGGGGGGASGGGTSGADTDSVDASSPLAPSCIVAPLLLAFGLWSSGAGVGA